jgi:uncharacterized membrane protein YfcA
LSLTAFSAIDPQALSPLALPLVLVTLAGGFAGFMSGLLGIGGGFVVVPALYLMAEPLGIEPEIAMHMALGTSLAAMIATTARSARAHDRLGSVDWPTLRQLVPVVILGAVAGALVASRLKGPILTASFALAAAGLSIRTALGREPDGKKQPSLPAMIQSLAGFAIGFASAVIGIGGAAFGAPLLARLGLNFKQVIGTAACIGVAIAIPASVIYGLTGWDSPGRPPLSLGYVNLPGCLLILGSNWATSGLGVRVHGYLMPQHLRWIFAAFLMATALRMTSTLL